MTRSSSRPAFARTFDNGWVVRGNRRVAAERVAVKRAPSLCVTVELSKTDALRLLNTLCVSDTLRSKL